MRLSALHEVSQSLLSLYTFLLWNQCLGAKIQGCQYSVEDLAEWCRDLISETEANPPSGVELDLSSMQAFYFLSGYIPRLRHCHF
ncbi:hypothetical protein CPB84DRAFT_1760602 [Gymnopilus junonius]|uniref:Uncharacterized protein n=1 Tax=Gymnopilus junonius TaxID=109634 RepID=A0A9P5TUJ2_GYMJU|nr:hypothetical protein CPB84DRAFT_1760602 [Gymnopilus junonius]